MMALKQLSLHISLVTSNRLHVSYDACLEDYQNCYVYAVLCTTDGQNDTHPHEQFLQLTI